MKKLFILIALIAIAIGMDAQKFYYNVDQVAISKSGVTPEITDFVSYEGYVRINKKTVNVALTRNGKVIDASFKISKKKKYHVDKNVVWAYGLVNSEKVEDRCILFLDPKESNDRFHMILFYSDYDIYIKATK